MPLRIQQNEAGSIIFLVCPSEQRLCVRMYMRACMLAVRRCSQTSSSSTSAFFKFNSTSQVATTSAAIIHQTVDTLFAQTVSQLSTSAHDLHDFANGARLRDCLRCRESEMYERQWRERHGIKFPPEKSSEQ